MKNMGTLEKKMLTFRMNSILRKRKQIWCIMS